MNVMRVLVMRGNRNRKTGGSEGSNEKCSGPATPQMKRTTFRTLGRKREIAVKILLFLQFTRLTPGCNSRD